MAVAILEQDQEATLGGKYLTDMEVDMDLRMAIMGTEVDLEVAIFGGSPGYWGRKGEYGG